MSDLVRRINEGFISKLASPDERTKLAAETGEYIMQRVRAKSFVDTILEPEPVALDQLERDIVNKTLHKVEEVEPDSFAIIGAPTGFAARAPITGDLVAIPVTRFETPLFSYNQRDLDVHRISITKILEENVVKDLSDQVDMFFMGICDKALSWLANPLGANDTHTYTPPTGTAFSKSVFLTAKQYLKDSKGRPYPMPRFLMNLNTYDRFLALDHSQLGYEIVGKIFADTPDFSTILNMKFILTPKTDIISNDVVYFFAPKDAETNFLGCNYTYRDLEFTVETYHNEEFEFRGKMERLMGLLNGYGVAKLIL